MSAPLVPGPASLAVEVVSVASDCATVRFLELTDNEGFQPREVVVHGQDLSHLSKEAIEALSQDVKTGAPSSPAGAP